MGGVLSALIAVSVLLYAAYVVYGMIKRKNRCGGGCAGCPYASGCDRKRSED